jgi:hypothetical protein
VIGKSNKRNANNLQSVGGYNIASSDRFVSGFKIRKGDGLYTRLDRMRVQCTVRAVCSFKSSNFVNVYRGE